MSTNLPAGFKSVTASPEQRFLHYARTGDKAAIPGLIAEFADRSYTQARRIVGRRDGAEDAVQDACFQLISTAKKYDGSVLFAAWLGRLVHVAALKYRERRMSRQVNLSDMSDQGEAAMSKQISEPDIPDRPEFEAVRVALEALPDRYRAPLTLYYFGGLNQNETAQAMGTPAGTIAIRLARGLEQLRVKLGRAGFAMTSAGLLAVFASIPTYAASPALKASLTASERLVSVGQQISQRMLEAKSISPLVSASVLAKTAVVAAVLLSGAIMLAPDPQAPAASQVDLQKGLVGYWKMDENIALNGSLMMDSSSSGNNGLLVTDNRANKSISGKFGRAVSFDGYGDYITLGQPESLLLTGAMTVACWARFSELHSHYRLVSKQGDSSANRSWDLCLENFNPDVLGFQISRDGKFEHDVFTQSIPADVPAVDVWTHIAAVYAPGMAVRIYKDGVMIAENTQGIPAVQHVANGTDILIGADSRMEGTEFNGAIDEVRIYNRALSGAEMAYLAQFTPVQ
jgi:RNA polymerase sigma factor (sigma-70 family)